LDADVLVKGQGYRPVNDRALLDRWMLSELALTTRDVTAHLEGYRVYEAALRLIDCVDALSNWYVRRSRERFWASGFSEDKRDAYWTLYACLTTLSRLCAPFIPFFAEEMYQNLVRRPWPGSQAESVHLCHWPTPDAVAVDEALSVEMKAVRDIVSLGLQVRTNNRLKVLARRDLKDRMKAYEGLITSELNVHEIHWLEPGQEGQEVVYKLKPNFRALGPKLGKRVQEAKAALAKADAGELRSKLVTDGKIMLDLPGGAVDLGPEEIEVTVEAAEGFAAAGDAVGVVVLHTKLDDALIDEGLERECLSRLQAIRKELSLEYTARIRVAIDGSERIRRVVEAAKARLAKEALASELVVGPATFEVEVTKEASLDGEDVVIRVGR
jgi:isoleucyl-tRNA synthetase